MPEGKVKWYDSTKGFGFITTDEGSDVFVHKNDLEPSIKLSAGLKVTFEVENAPKGRKAIKVRIVS